MNENVVADLPPPIMTCHPPGGLVCHSVSSIPDPDTDVKPPILPNLEIPYSLRPSQEPLPEQSAPGETVRARSTPNQECLPTPPGLRGSGHPVSGATIQVLEPASVAVCSAPAAKDSPHTPGEDGDTECSPTPVERQGSGHPVSGATIQVLDVSSSVAVGFDPAAKDTPSTPEADGDTTVAAQPPYPACHFEFLHQAASLPRIEVIETIRPCSPVSLECQSLNEPQDARDTKSCDVGPTRESSREPVSATAACLSAPPAILSEADSLPPAIHTRTSPEPDDPIPQWAADRLPASTICSFLARTPPGSAVNLRYADLVGKKSGKFSDYAGILLPSGSVSITETTRRKGKKPQSWDLNLTQPGLVITVLTATALADPAPTESSRIRLDPTQVEAQASLIEDETEARSTLTREHTSKLASLKSAFNTPPAPRKSKAVQLPPRDDITPPTDQVPAAAPRPSSPPPPVRNKLAPQRRTPPPQATPVQEPTATYIPLSPEEVSRLPTYRSLEKPHWPALQRAFWSIIAAYDPNAGPSAENTEIFHKVLDFSANKLRKTRGYTRARSHQLKRQLGSDAPVPYTQHRDVPPSSPDTVDEIPLEDRQSVRAAKAKLAQGGPFAIGKAARLLATDAVQHTLTPDELREELQRLHPTRKQPIPPMPHTEHDCLAVDPASLVKALADLRSAAAPGPSGLTEELLYAIVQDERCAGKLAQLICDIRRRRVSNVIRLRLLLCKLIAAGKPGKTTKLGSVRPIAVGEVLVKIASATSVQECTGAIRSEFGDLQRSDVELGAEQIIHETQAEVDLNHAHLTIDCSNAFNEIMRAAIAAELYSNPSLGPLWGPFDFAYNIQSELIVDDTLSIISDEGSRQGDLAGGIYFGLGINPCLKKVAAEHPQLTLLRAFHDDINASGSTSAVLAAFDTFREILAEIGLTVNDKSEIYLPDGETLPEKYKDLIRVAHGGIKVLGAFISRSAENRATWVEERIGQHDKFFHRVPHLGPSLAMPVLRKCGAPRMNYLIRTHPAEVTAQACKIFDARTRHAHETILQAPGPWSRESQLLSILPMSSGGAGIPEMSLIADIAYKASRDHSLQGKTSLTPSQKTASTVIYNVLAAEVDALGPLEKGHRTACSARNASLWSDVPLPPAKFPGTEYRAASRWRLSIPEIGTRSENTCDGCGYVCSQREYTAHRPSCALVKVQNVSSISCSVKKSLQTLAAIQRIPYTNEPRYDGYVSKSSSHKLGPDTQYHMSPPLDEDVKTVNMSCATNCRLTFNAIEKSLTEEVNGLYGTFATKAGYRLRTSVVSLQGGFGHGTMKTINELVDVDPRTLDVDGAVLEVQVAMQRALGRVMLRSVARV